MAKLILFVVPLLLLFHTVKAQPGQPETGTKKSGKYTFDYIKVCPDSVEIGFFWKDRDGRTIRSLDGLRSMLLKKHRKILMLTNGGMFLENRRPQGLYIEQGIQLVPADTGEGDANFHMKPNGIFLITVNGPRIIETSEYNKTEDSVIFATQSGPMLLLNGTIHPSFNRESKSRYIRSGVGIGKDKGLIFAISNQPVNLHTFASLFRDEWGCKDALYLDGAISKMVIPGIGRMDTGGDFGCMIAILKKTQKGGN